MDEIVFQNAFLRKEASEAIPEGFDAATLPLDATKKSKFNWTIEQSALPVIYELDLGLFFDLTNSLPHVAQFQALSFAVDTFVSRVDFPAGCILYKGPILEEDDKIDFLSLLVNALPPHITPFTLQDASHIQDPIHFANMMLKFARAGFKTAFKNPPFSTDSLVWEEGCSRGGYIGSDVSKREKAEDAKVGIVVTDLIEEEKKALLQLIEDGVAFRIIPEERLTTEWDGIDEMIVGEQVGPLTRRMLQGFEAAGGRIVS